ncbi:MAG TPA: nitroreductase family protein [Nitrospirota bacterium]|nr:nitroreductase family protein [Nitrospirota bacterium]
MQELLRLIQTRQSARVLFDPGRPLHKKDLQYILEAGRWAPTAHNMQNFEIIVVDDRKLLERIANLRYPTSLAFVRENYRQLSFSEEELRRKKVGILGTMFPPSWRKPNVKPEDIAGIEENPFIKKAIQSSAVLLIVLYDPGRRAPASEGDFLGIMSLGCVMENMWLMAHSLSIGCHVVSSLSAEPVQKELKGLLNIPEHLMLAFSLRLGYPASKIEYLRVRRDIDDCTHSNQYGKRGLD